jgi:transmembrane sensor
VNESVLNAAIGWAVRLKSGSVSVRDNEAHAFWLNENPEHRQAWQQVTLVDNAFAAVPIGGKALAYSALDLARQSRRRRRRQATILSVVTIGSVWVAVVAYSLWWPSPQLLMTRHGERFETQLADGTRILLNTTSQVEVRFTPFSRSFRVYEGEIFIDTGADEHAPFLKRTFRLHTMHGSVRPLGTRFTVRLNELNTTVHVMQGAVSLLPQQASAPAIVAAGRTLTMSTQVAVAARERRGLDPAGWINATIVANNMKLGDLLQELNRYSTQRLQCDGTAAQLKVSGVFQLGPNMQQGVQRAVSMLQVALPLHVEQLADGSQRLHLN